MMRRFRLNSTLLILGVITATATATWLFMSGYWPQGCLCVMVTASCVIILINLQSRLTGTMSAFVKAIEMNDTTMRIDAGGDHELQSMAESMNRIAEMYHTGMNELQTRKLYYDRVLKIMTHEMRNGITPILAISADILSKPERYSGANLTSAATLINTQAEGMHRFLESYYKLTHLPDPNPEAVSASDYVRIVKRLVDSEIEARHIPADTVEYTVANDMTLNIDITLMNQVIFNLVRNALDAIPDEVGKVGLIISASEGRPFITVRDNGTGFSKSAMENLFEPFFTTKRHGSGVGLSISRQIIRKHGGDIRIQSNPDKGTLVMISL